MKIFLDLHQTRKACDDIKQKLVALNEATIAQDQEWRGILFAHQQAKEAGLAYATTIEDRKRIEQELESWSHHVLTTERPKIYDLEDEVLERLSVNDREIKKLPTDVDQYGNCVKKACADIETSFSHILRLCSLFHSDHNARDTLIRDLQAEVVKLHTYIRVNSVQHLVEQLKKKDEIIDLLSQKNEHTEVQSDKEIKKVKLELTARADELGAANQRLAARERETRDALERKNNEYSQMYNYFMKELEKELTLDDTSRSPNVGYGYQNNRDCGASHEPPAIPEDIVRKSIKTVVSARLALQYKSYSNRLGTIKRRRRVDTIVTKFCVKLLIRSTRNSSRKLKSHRDYLKDRLVITEHELKSVQASARVEELEKQLDQLHATYSRTVSDYAFIKQELERQKVSSKEVISEITEGRLIFKVVHRHLLFHQQLLKGQGETISQKIVGAMKSELTNLLELLAPIIRLQTASTKHVKFSNDTSWSEIGTLIRGILHSLETLSTSEKTLPTVTTAAPSDPPLLSITKMKVPDQMPKAPKGEFSPEVQPNEVEMRTGPELWYERMRSVSTHPERIRVTSHMTDVLASFFGSERLILPEQDEFLLLTGNAACIAQEEVSNTSPDFIAEGRGEVRSVSTQLRTVNHHRVRTVCSRATQAVEDLDDGVLEWEKEFHSHQDRVKALKESLASCTLDVLSKEHREIYESMCENEKELLQNELDIVLHNTVVKARMRHLAKRQNLTGATLQRMNLHHKHMDRVWKQRYVEILKSRKANLEGMLKLVANDSSTSDSEKTDSRFFLLPNYNRNHKTVPVVVNPNAADVAQRRENEVKSPSLLNEIQRVGRLERMLEEVSIDDLPLPMERVFDDKDEIWLSKTCRQYKHLFPERGPHPLPPAPPPSSAGASTSRPAHTPPTPTRPATTARPARGPKILAPARFKINVPPPRAAPHDATENIETSAVTKS